HDVLLNVMQDEGIFGRKRQRIEDASAAIEAEASRATLDAIEAAVRGLFGRPTGTMKSVPALYPSDENGGWASQFVADGDYEVRVSAVLAVIQKQREGGA